MFNGNGKLNGDKRKSRMKQKEKQKKTSLKVFFDETKKAAGKMVRLFVRLLSLSGRERLAAMMKFWREFLLDKIGLMFFP
jgi:hypothetical protein